MLVDASFYRSFRVEPARTRIVGMERWEFNSPRLYRAQRPLNALWTTPDPAFLELIRRKKVNLPIGRNRAVLYRP
jgi:hypothetical protein